ncbi:ALG6, ALG8 glycosyltransferase [Ascobolus immersus RN42]|uniref:Alpha-1,3-glucosyltransferase n=1 Tax=Ascobolus immersus RN42 TaxID=1160509 RepID=A0A3N4IQR0_ASCIM|nr:ALG6, ALG8 glycosyltransferase [Ascobolus immersus RN42]
MVTTRSRSRTPAPTVTTTTPAPVRPRTPSRKPRKKRTARSVSFSLPALPFPLASVLHPLRSSSAQWLLLPVLLSVGFLFRWAVGLGPYSGFQSPPMHGDFEAQRHWMEITTRLPMKEWYFHDLEWWGLDYPPLTAYHSWLCGKIGSLINPAWFDLYTSRKSDDPMLKLFMRATAIASEYVTYVPGLIFFVRIYGKQNERSKYDQGIALAALLMQPGLMIIDHGHFQYNAVMLGFTVLAICNFITDHLFWGSFFFVLSLGFKQMGLYYAPAVFAYLLGLCVFPRIDLQRFILLGLTVVATFAALIAPLYFFGGGLDGLLQCLIRVFPFNRGLWEDKVANFWCASNVVVKLRETYSTTTLQRLSLAATLAAIAPPCTILFLYPRRRILPLGLSACAWGFFLFSFQVHEKSVLIPLMPLTLLLAGGLDRDTVSWVSFFNTLAMFSMYPLLRRDGLVLQYLVTTGLWAYLTGFWNLPTDALGKLVQIGGYLGMVGLHVAELAVGPVARFPDLWVVGNVLLSFGVFAWAYLWTVWGLVKEVQKEQKKKSQ